MITFSTFSFYISFNTAMNPTQLKLRRFTAPLFYGTCCYSIHALVKSDFNNVVALSFLLVTILKNMTSPLMEYKRKLESSSPNFLFDHLEEKTFIGQNTILFVSFGTVAALKVAECIMGFCQQQKCI